MARLRGLVVAGIMVLLLGSISACGGASREVPLKRTVVELLEIQPPFSLSKIAFSPDSRHIAVVVPDKDSSKERVLIGTTAGKAYDEILGLPVFSPDSQHLAYRAREGDKWFVVLDSIEGKKYDYKEYDYKDGIGYDIGLGPVFSPDSQRLAYTAREGNMWFTVVDGKEGMPYWRIPDMPIFSPDSKHIAYRVLEGETEFLVMDNEGGKKYTHPWEIRQVFFNPNDSSLVYVVSYSYRIILFNDMKSYVVVNGDAGKVYDEVAFGAFSPDGQHLAYRARKGDKWFVVLDGIEGKKYDYVSYGPIFSPDSKRLAYTAKEGNEWFAIVDGNEGNRYKGGERLWQFEIGDVSFSPDSKRVAYIVEDKTLHYGFVVVDGIEEGHYDIVGPPLFSPDSTRLAYAAVVGNKTCVVVDGWEGRKYSSVDSLVFSPDSKHVVYRSRNEGRFGRGWRQFVVIDGIEGRRYEITDTGYLGDGVDIVFESPSRLYYATEDKGRFYIVQETIS